MHKLLPAATMMMIAPHHQTRQRMHQPVFTRAWQVSPIPRVGRSLKYALLGWLCLGRRAIVRRGALVCKSMRWHFLHN